jgi:hypothetical protein
MKLQRPPPVYTDARHIPADLATSRTWRAYRNRQPVPKVEPAAYYRPPDWRPRFAPAPGVPRDFSPIPTDFRRNFKW